MNLLFKKLRLVLFILLGVMSLSSVSHGEQYTQVPSPMDCKRFRSGKQLCTYKVKNSGGTSVTEMMNIAKEMTEDSRDRIRSFRTVGQTIKIILDPTADAADVADLNEIFAELDSFDYNQASVPITLRVDIYTIDQSNSSGYNFGIDGFHKADGEKSSLASNIFNLVTSNWLLKFHLDLGASQGWINSHRSFMVPTDQGRQLRGNGPIVGKNVFGTFGSVGSPEQELIGLELDGKVSLYDDGKSVQLQNFSVRYSVPTNDENSQVKTYRTAPSNVDLTSGQSNIRYGFSISQNQNEKGTKFLGANKSRLNSTQSVYIAVTAFVGENQLNNDFMGGSDRFATNEIIQRSLTTAKEDFNEALTSITSGVDIGNLSDVFGQKPYIKIDSPAYSNIIHEPIKVIVSSPAFDSKSVRNLELQNLMASKHYLPKVNPRKMPIGELTPISMTIESNVYGTYHYDFVYNFEKGVRSLRRVSNSSSKNKNWSSGGFSSDNNDCDGSIIECYDQY